MKKSLILAVLMIGAVAQAKSFSVGDNILCNKWEGKIEELYQKNEAKVKFYNNYTDGNVKPVDSTEVLNIDHCLQQLPTDSKIGKLDIGSKDILACNKWIGEVVSVFEENTAKVKFTSNFNNGNEAGVSSTEVLNIDHCNKQLPARTIIANDITTGDSIMCNKWEGTVLNVFSSDLARVLFTANYVDGSKKTVSSTELLEISHCNEKF